MLTTGQRSGSLLPMKQTSTIELTTGQVAKALGLTAYEVRKLYAEGKIKPHRHTGGNGKTYRHPRVTVAEVERFRRVAK